jgi:hypothetical protein
LHPAIAWIFRKTRSFPSPAHAGFGFEIGNSARIFNGKVVIVKQNKALQREQKQEERKDSQSQMKSATATR